jgi:hypothetical protein
MWSERLIWQKINGSQKWNSIETRASHICTENRSYAGGHQERNCLSPSWFSWTLLMAYSFSVLRSCQRIRPFPRYFKWFATYIIPFLWWGVVKPPRSPKAGVPPPVGCSRLLIQYIRSYPPYLKAVSSIPSAMPWWQGTHLTWHCQPLY